MEIRRNTLAVILGAGMVLGGSIRAQAHPVGDPKFRTSAPAFDVNGVRRAACAYRPGDKTAKTIGPNVPTGDKLPFKHVIVLMMENRSFDHYYSALSKPSYYGDAIDVATERDCNPDPATRTSVCRFKETRYCVRDTAHSWDEVHAQFNGGKLDGFVKTSNPNGARAMGYYTDEDIPFYYWLANTFAISDRYFSPLLGSTWPNRWFLYGATSWGRIKTPDVPVMPWELKKNTNVVKQLEAAGRTVRFYRAGLITWFEAGFADPTRMGHSISRFEEDVRQNKLADVTFIDPNFIITHFEKARAEDNDEHPPSNIQKGQAYAARVVRALMSNPKVWRKSVLFITYDEHGGLYDHVVPPRACEPGGVNSSGKRFDRYGFRVPLFVVSPFAKKHYVSHVVADHSSIVRFIQNRFNLGALTRRDANAWPLLDLFDFQNPPFLDPPAPPAAVVDPVKEKACRDSDPGTGGPAMSDADLARTCARQAEKEPNGSVRQAVDLGKIGCHNLLRRKNTLRGTLRGAADVDYFKFHGKDAITCIANAVAKNNTAGVDLCMFAVCDEGATQLKSCGKGSTAKGTMMGMGAGCCRSARGDIKMNFNCKGTTNESATFYLRVSQKENRCLQYEVDYHF